MRSKASAGREKFVFADWRERLRSLRFRLVAGASLVLVIMMIIVIGNGARLMSNTLIERENARLDELKLLLNASLAKPLAEHDEDTLEDLLRQLRRDNDFVYLVLQDHNHRLV